MKNYLAHVLSYIVPLRIYLIVTLPGNTCDYIVGWLAGLEMLHAMYGFTGNTSSFNIALQAILLTEHYTALKEYNSLPSGPMQSYVATAASTPGETISGELLQLAVYNTTMFESCEVRLQMASAC